MHNKHSFYFVSFPVIKHTPKPPKQFRGNIKDIPIVEEVLKLVPGFVITNRAGTKHVWRWSATRQDCYRDCVYEALIDCRVYYYYGIKDICIMMDQGYQDGKFKCYHICTHFCT